jgi:hypothetical protein
MFNHDDIPLLDKAIAKVMDNISYRNSVTLGNLIKAGRPLLAWQESSAEDKEAHFNQALNDLNTFTKTVFNISFAQWAAYTDKDNEIVILATKRPGIDINEVFSLTITLLGILAESGKTELVKYLLTIDGININKHGDDAANHPLILAIKKRHAEIALLLLNDNRIVIPEELLNLAVKHRVKKVIDHMLALPETKVNKNLLVQAIRYDAIDLPIFKALFNHSSTSLLNENDLHHCIVQALNTDSHALQILLTHPNSNPNRLSTDIEAEVAPLFFASEYAREHLLAHPKIDLTAKRKTKTKYSSELREMTLLEFAQRQKKELEKKVGGGEDWGYYEHHIKEDKVKIQEMKVLESRMIHAHTEQFYREAILSDPKGKESIIKKHEEAKLTPKALCDYMVSKIMEKLETDEEADMKFQILLGEKQQIFEDINQPSPKNALISYILPEKTYLMNQIDTQLKIINAKRGVAAPPTNVTYTIASSSTSINEESPAPSLKAKDVKGSSLSHFFKKK